MPKVNFAAVADFVDEESRSAGILLVAAVAALVWANSPFDAAYASLFHDTDLSHAIGDGLMAVFFLVVGLEVSREVREGELRGGALVPAVAAVGGMVVPAVVFVAVAGGDAARGWAIPTATDVAFALGALTVLGSRISPALRAFLLALAVVDDILAVLVIATVYAHGAVPAYLLLAVAALVLYTVASRRPSVPWPVLLVLALVTWWAVRESGVHATIAGVAIGIATPPALAHRLEDLLHPWSAFVVLPVFALANAGVDLGDAALGRVSVGVTAALVAGKPLGIVAGAWLGSRRRPLPAGVTMGQVVGVGALGGIGFTVSLFVTGLAYTDAGMVAQAKLGILAGSLLAAVAGLVVLRRTTTPAG